MDTEWFAVDEYGRVGRFYTGEDGALPHDAATGFGPSDGVVDLLELDVARAIRFAASGDDVHWREGFRPAPGRTLVGLAPDEEDEEAELPGWAAGAFELRSRSGDPARVLLSRSPLALARVEELRARADVRWTLSVDDLPELLEGVELVDGLFRFGRDHGDDPGRYERGAAPEDPLTVDWIRGPASVAIARTRLPVDFNAAPVVHLADHMDEAATARWGELPLRYTEAFSQRREQAAAAVRQRSRRTLVYLAVLLGALALLASLT